MIKRVLFFLLLIVVLSGGGLYLFRERLLVIGFNRLGPLVLGTDVSVEDVEWGPFLNRIRVQGVSVMQPEGFGDAALVEIPEILVDVDPVSVITRRWRVRHARLNLKRVHLIQNHQGRWNFEALKPLAQQKEDRGAAVPGEGEKPGPRTKARPFRIDLLELKVDEVVIERRHKEGTADRMRLRIGLNERIEEVDDVRELVRAVMGRVLWKTPLANIPIVSDMGLNQVITTGVDQALKLPSKAVGTAAETMEGAAKTLKETATEVLKIFSSD